MKTMLYVTAASLGFAFPAVAEMAPVESVDVTFDATAIESEAAAEFWADLEGDLEEAMLARVAGNIGEGGATIEVDIDEFDMSNSFQAALGADSSLAAAVEIDGPAGSQLDTRYDAKVTLEQAGGFSTDATGTEVKEIPVEDAYTRMINVFADSIVAKLG